MVLLIANYNGVTGSYPSWVLYPCALGMMVLSKSFSVLRSAVTVFALATALTGKLIVAALATLVTSAAAAIAKVSLDASLQDDLPEKSRASAFGRSESLLQLGWVAGAALGVLV